jgi:hypothetical protein
VKPHGRIRPACLDWEYRGVVPTLVEGGLAGRPVMQLSKQAHYPYLPFELGCSRGVALDLRGVPAVRYLDCPS